MAALPPLPPGWTENKAPSGHTYYYNAKTKESTYRRPGAASASLPPPPPPPPSIPPPAAAHPPPQAMPNAPFPHRPSFQQPLHQPFPQHGPQLGPQPPFLNLSDPRVANAFTAQKNAAAGGHSERGGHGGCGRGDFGGRGGRGGANGRPRPQPKDKPRSCFPIPGHESWALVYTKYGRRFVYNTAKNTSYWRIPEKLMPAVLEMDKAGIRPGRTEKKKEEDKDEPVKDKKKEEADKMEDVEEGVVVPLAEDYDSNYEEVEVTDDEGEDGVDGDEGRRKRQRTEDTDADMYGDGGGEGPVEFGEDDIAFQLAAAKGMMDEQYYDDEGGEDYGDEPYDDDADDDSADGVATFKAMLDDFKINPFSAWEKLIEEGQVFDDPRYTALPTMKARKAVWEEWSRDRIREKKQKEEEARKEKKKDPKAAYLKLLQDYATPKLYWPEFKRKYRKEPAMKDVLHPPDKEKEKLYRDYVARRKLPAATRKTDLLKLLESLPKPASVGNDEDLPLDLTGDLRYVAVEPTVRDPLVNAFYKSAA
ncbi:ff domain-containing protein [Ophiostoma piceae UAMH 11346]|uniref:Ff domain-containing protein n=1 Tax=Ophiostoma piceae (strain UAMH 11346) TaxID=1262450 RepID=S3BRZ1_OPHP1|nr:ff domain-containing protein [Ophiostoma piceae UAMH 11346]